MEMLGRDPDLSMEPSRGTQGVQETFPGRAELAGDDREAMEHPAALDTSLPAASGKAGVGIFPAAGQP